MDPKPKTSPKDFFLHLGAIVVLYTVVISLLNLLFTVIEQAYPKINNYYGYFGSSSLSWPVAILIIFFPIYIVLMWALEKSYKENEEKRQLGVRRWLTYITLFVSGLVLAGDLVTVLYYFIDGQELTIGFLLKVLSVLVVTAGVFTYYISDIRNKLNGNSRKTWAIIATVIILGSIIWGFSVLGSPRTQRLYKYDEQKTNDLTNIQNEINNYYSQEGNLPATLDELNKNYYSNHADPQSQKSYEYAPTSQNKYNICADFNKDSKQSGYGQTYPQGSWTHPAGRYCFAQTINPNTYAKPMPVY